MKLVGKVLSLCISKKETKLRVKQQKIFLDENGVVDDKFYGKDIQRSILLASTYSYDLVKENNIDINENDLGENILMDYNPYSLPIGTKIQIGEAIVEISQEGTLCNGLSKVNKALPKLLKKDRGIFAKTIKEGNIALGDEIYLLC
jgi:MOSC domain-containing protein YiiM